MEQYRFSPSSCLLLVLAVPAFGFLVLVIFGIIEMWIGPPELRIGAHVVFWMALLIIWWNLLVASVGFGIGYANLTSSKKALLSDKIAVGIHATILVGSIAAFVFVVILMV